MMPRLHFFVTIFLCLAINTSKAQEINQIEKFERVLQLVNFFYVDQVADEKLMESAISGMLKEMDPHSVYLTKQELNESNQKLAGEFVGIGINYSTYNDTLLVISPIKNSPSDKAGIRSGDRIIRIDGHEITGNNVQHDSIRNLIQGSQGSRVFVTVKRPEEVNYINYSIAREKIPIPSIDASYMIDKKTGYIRLNRFSSSSAEEFKREIKKLKKEGMKNLIFDLRDNGGGFLMVAINILDEFLHEKKLLVYTEGARSAMKEHYSTKTGLFKEGKLIVLINEGSASASEIVSGALQDWDRGIIIGRRSFGKGLVQRTFSLPDGSALRLTTARYFTPTGRLIQKSYEAGYEAYRHELDVRMQNGEYINSEKIHFIDSLKYYTLDKKRLVYGGGGIMPDVFVAVDTLTNSAFFNELKQKEILHNFVIHYMDNNQLWLDKFKNFSDFDENFLLEENIYFLFSEFAKEKWENAPKDNQNACSKNLIWDNEQTIEFIENGDTPNSMFYINKDVFKSNIKALIARNIWGTNEYYYLINKHNETFNSAKQIMNRNVDYEDLANYSSELSD